MDVQRVDNLSGSIELINLDGSINVLGNGVDQIAVSAGGNGAIKIDAVGNSSSVLIGRAIESGLGDVRLLAGRNVIFNPDGDVSSDDGAIVVRGDQAVAGNGAVVGMSDGAVVDAGIGTIDIQTDGRVTVGSLSSTNTADAILVVSRADGINDGGDQDIDLIANSGTVTLRTQSGIGGTDSIESEIAVLNADATTSGAIRLIETDSVVLNSLIANNGQVTVSAGGTITAVDVQSTNANMMDDVGANGDANSRDILLSATGDTSDILVDRVVALAGADVFLVADDDVLETDESDSRRIEADDLFVSAGNANVDQSDAISLSTAVEDLEIFVAGAARGDLEIRELDSLNLAASDRQDDSQRIETSNGEIRVFAGDSIFIADPDIQNETATLNADPELVASGDNGRVELRAANLIQFGDAVQLHASQSTINAVVIESDAIEWGEEIEINTGSGVGVARVFSPRPDVNLVDTAFYESTSVGVNILEQAAINDAEGQLTLVVGNEGERGLTINIDWGAETRRFQQIDNLSGDAPPLTVAHVYLEEDILNSRLNDRESETAPLNVKFSVRHHESILVLGSTVTQGGSDVEQVDGLRVSSTDNPLTAESESAQILENGTARFIIPSLSIPVAFFPVREVIPETEEPAQFTRRETTVALSQSTFETTETTVSTSVSREEYFQIRVLSPDPDGEDLAPAERLPEDILDGDKLFDLFRNLPDGRYAIEYVLGDGNERSILQVDLRDGKPIILGDELDGGPLRLRLIEGGTDDRSTENQVEQDDQVEQDEEAIEVLKKKIQQGVMRVKAVPDGSLDVTDVEPTSRNDLAATVAASTIAVGRRGKFGRFSAVARFLARGDREHTA